jgi:predicted dehydrogenase
VDTTDHGPIRVAILGTGNIARVHARALRELGDEVEIVAASDIDSPRLSAFCDEQDIRHAYLEIEDLLTEARPQLVHVCTPPHVHCPQALSCLRGGASVLVEKPPTLSLAEFDEIVAAEDATIRSGPWFATVFQHRFGSGHRRLKALSEAGVLGRPLVAVCHTTWYRDQAYYDVPWRGRWSTEGGGPTMGHGIHQMDMLADILGEWSEVSAVARRQTRRMETEDLSLAHVTFTNGAVASVLNSVLSPRQESYLRFDFERATVELRHLYGYRDEDWRITASTGYELDMLAAWDSSGSAPSFRSGHFSQFASVIRSLRDGTAPSVIPSESRRTLSLVAAIYASAFTGRTVRPEDMGPGSPFYARMNGDGVRW